MNKNENAPKPTEEKAETLKLIRMSEIATEQVKWLWYPYIPFVSVKEIYKKYVYEGMGYLRISDYLTKNGMFFDSGKRINYAAIRRILKTPLYTGIMVCGDVRSGLIPELQIIDNELFLQAQKLRGKRAEKHGTAKQGNEPNGTSTTPSNMRGNALLSGKIYCAACGGKLYISQGGRIYTKKNGTKVDYRQNRYICHNKNRKLCDCSGQTSYDVVKMDGLVTEFLLGLFQNIKGSVENDLIDKSYQSEVASCKTKLKGANAELHKHTESLKALQGEVVKAIQGESKFDSAMLNDLIAQTKEKIESSTETVNRYKSELENRNQYLTDIQADYNRLITWAEVFQDSNTEAKKMITAYLIKSIKVSRGYKLDIVFNVAFEQFFSGL